MVEISTKDHEISGFSLEAHLSLNLEACLSLEALCCAFEQDMFSSLLSTGSNQENTMT